MKTHEKEFYNVVKLLTTAEGLIIYTALNELILRIESESEGKDPALVADTLKYISNLREKYKIIAKTPITVDDQENR